MLLRGLVDDVSGKLSKATYACLCSAAPRMPSRTYRRGKLSTPCRRSKPRSENKATGGVCSLAGQTLRHIPSLMPSLTRALWRAPHLGRSAHC